MKKVTTKLKIGKDGYNDNYPILIIRFKRDTTAHHIFWTHENQKAVYIAFYEITSFSRINSL